ncbi:hypothetical protein Lal_00018826 [Lupinus albus]|nr:hypothetical protein Lal_00018826 [Lupinus albus]
MVFSLTLGCVSSVVPQKSYISLHLLQSPMFHFHRQSPPISDALAQARDSRSGENLTVTNVIDYHKVWGQRNLNYRGIPHGDLTGYRSCMNHMDVNDFKWLPYENYVNNLSREVLQDKKIWSACTTLICFFVVEWHQTDRVRLQFRFVQDLPQPPQNLDALHIVDKQGNLDTNWATRHAEWIKYWSYRRDQVLQAPQIQYPIHTQQYIMWYRRYTRLFLSSKTQLRDSRQINFQQNQPPIYQTYQPPIYQQNQPPTYQPNQPPTYYTNQPPQYYTNQPPIPQTSMFQPTMNLPTMS